MALFELENGRLVPAQFGRDVPDGFTDTVLSVVRSQVLEIVSRPLFPIYWSNADTEEQHAIGSRLTALDASGQVVAVEVMRMLDADALIDSLSRLADTASLSWSDLANRYPLGPDGFRREWVNFREAMPPSPPNGPRLILVTSKITDEVRPALDVLSSSGVEVHQMSLRQMSNGRAFLEVEAVGPRLYGHRASTLLETSAVLPVLGSSKQGGEDGEPAPNALARPERAEVRGGRADASSPGGAPEPTGEPAAPQEPGGSHAPESGSTTDTEEAAPVAAEPSHDHRRTVGAAGSSTAPHLVAPQAASPSAGAPEVSITEENQPFPRRRSRASGGITTALPPRRVRSHSAAAESVPAPALPEPLHVTRTPVSAPAQVAEALQQSAPVVPSPLPSRRKMRATEGAAEPRRSRMRPGIPLASRSERHREPGAGTVGHGSSRVGEPVGTEGLVAIAHAAGTDVALFLRSAERTPEGAVLSGEGVIIVPSGRYDDPTAALRAEGIWGSDGWESWRIGDPAGPTLAEALAELRG